MSLPKKSYVFVLRFFMCVLGIFFCLPQTSYSKNVGLENPTATRCWCNAMLQCFLKIRPLAEFLHTYHDKDPEYKTKITKVGLTKKEKVLIEYIKLNEQVNYSDKFEKINPNTLYQAIKMEQDLKLDEQQDTLKALNALSHAVSDRTFSKHVNFTDLISTKCLNECVYSDCSFCKETIESSSNSKSETSLFLNKDSKIKFSDLTTQLLQGIYQIPDSWTIDCQKCKAKNSITVKQKTFFISFPKIFVFKLDRGGLGSPLSRDSTDIPDCLDLSQYLSDKKQKAQYKLFAVVANSGTTTGGHYWAYAKNFNDENWNKYNDSAVSPEDIKTICEDPKGQTMYLFYQKIPEEQKKETLDALVNKLKQALEVLKSKLIELSKKLVQVNDAL